MLYDGFKFLRKNKSQHRGSFTGSLSQQIYLLKVNVPTAFITYSHDNDGHCAKAISLANRLREDGVDVSIDAYEPHPSEGWPKWMERQFQQEYLIIVLSPRYINDFNQDRPSHSGARYEGAIVSALLLRRGVAFDKIAIVCFENWPDLDVPLVLSGCTRYCTDQPADYKKLFAFLTGQTLIVKPPLGTIVSIQSDSGMIPVTQQRSFSTLCKAIAPLLAENRRIFEDFGPNSGAAKLGETERSVRFDLTLWKRQRLTIGKNNRVVAQFIRADMDIIPSCHGTVFRQLLSHIEAFAHHLVDEDVDYRDHLFPQEIVHFVNDEL